jgi:hypothetical protein
MWNSLNLQPHQTLNQIECTFTEHVQKKGHVGITGPVEHVYFKPGQEKEAREWCDSQHKLGRGYISAVATISNQIRKEDCNSYWKSWHTYYFFDASCEGSVCKSCHQSRDTVCCVVVQSDFCSRCNYNAWQQSVRV